ncbi:transglycosylase domain-containing protein [Streptomyces sp. RB6PN25]|uniref:Transglycosylase domain-containing protein n=1 Tax=Streptomyces humicola TaxID=2953240 RepID=A0ABT1Q4Z8_9ACTN|nr:biosynthetic peptidoglycan transglycosylase [Streptomyces humicola]MCQ4084994.1 transglycosylase domain-containing protein [Streptomyces humicola]
MQGQRPPGHDQERDRRHHHDRPGHRDRQDNPTRPPAEAGAGAESRTTQPLPLGSAATTAGAAVCGTAVLIGFSRPLLGITIGELTSVAVVATAAIVAVAVRVLSVRRRRPSPGRPMRWLWRLVAIAAALLVLGGAGMGILFSATPGVGDAEARVRAQAAARHTNVAAPAPASKVTAALIAAEDARFYTDPGIDFRGAARATAAWLRGVGDAGGSTLEQQLARMLYIKGRSSRADQMEQVALGVKLARRWPKSAILQMYLDSADFGHGYYGIDAASEGYFRTSPDRLDWPQAALLAGLVQAPAAYDPLRHPAHARKRRAYVLRRLEATGVLSRAQVHRYLAAPLGLASNPPAGSAPSAPASSAGGSGLPLAPVTDRAPAHR